jgi:hypothetical protein
MDCWMTIQIHAPGLPTGFGSMGQCNDGRRRLNEELTPGMDRCGKTSLLTVVAGMADGAHVEGTVRVNGQRQVR